MRNGDVVTAEAILNRFTNKLEIRGAVYRPGIYQLNGKLNTVRELVNEAQGLTGDAFLNRAVLYRQREDLTTEVIPVDIKAIMDGTSQNIILAKNDILYIPSIHDLEDRGDVVIHGEVAKPDSYPYADNMTLEDLIIQAGGLREAASVVRVDVSRRIKNPRSTVDNDTIGQIYTFSLKEGFVVDGTPGFVLQPYDEVYVRRSPGYQAQQNVVVEGEILFGGSYAMTNREERLSDLINKAGGATNYAYLRGAKLTRVATEGEKKRMGDVIRLMSRQLGEAMMDSLGVRVEDTFSVGIDLEKALANPGSTADIVLREGDVISIPKNNNTVTINGAVMVPNTVSYIEGQKVDYYLDQAGGYSENAKKSKKFIVYMNGQVTKVIGIRKKIYKAAGIGLIIGVIVAISIPKQYTVEVTLSPEMGNNKGGGLSGLAASFLGSGVSMGDGTDALNASLSADIVSSTPFLLELSNMKVPVSGSEKISLSSYLDEESSPWWSYVIGFPGMVIGGVKSLFIEDEDESIFSDKASQGTIELSKKESQKIESLKKKIVASVDKKTSMTSVTATFQDSKVAAVVADSVVKKLQEYIMDYRTSKSKEDCLYLEKLFKERQQEYYEAQRKYADYMDSHDNIILQSVRTEQERLQNDMSLAYQVYSQVAGQLQVARAKVQEEKPVFAVVEPAVVPLYPSGTSRKVYVLVFVFLSVCIVISWNLFGKDLLSKFKEVCA